MGRLRRAHGNQRSRASGLERFSEDEDTLENLADTSRGSSGENLLAKFNRLARDSTDASGIPGEIAGFDGASVIVRTDDGHEHPCQVRSVLKKMFHGVKNPLVVGDQVELTFTEHDEAVIVGLRERHNQLARADSHNKALIHVFAANVDRLVIVAAVRDPEIRTGLIDRYLVIAHHNDIEPVIVLNKIDLGPADEVAELYRSLGYPVFTTCASDPSASAIGIDALRHELTSKRCVFAGHSGVGKSSLVNALYPTLGARTGQVSSAVNKGRHTTTAARSYALPDHGRLIDTPGIRECGITGMTPVDVALLYRDLAQYHHDCRFANCTHVHEPDCAVQAAVQAGAIDPRRYQSYVGIIYEDLA